MDGPYSRSRSHKRSSQYDDGGPGDDSNGRYKRYQSSSYSPRGGPPPPPRTPKFMSGEIVFRILCPESLVGSIIGKGGSIVKNLRQETGARITIQDAIPGSEERVVLISSYDGGEREVVCPAQEALFRVHSRIFESGIEEEGLNRSIKTRLVVPNNQVGCLLGKGGKIIEQMREETKAQIRVLPRDQLPLCTLPSDEIVQVAGELSVVKKALNLISSRLKGNPPRERERERDREREREREWERGQPSPSLANVYSPDRHIQSVDAFSPHGGPISSHAHEDGPLPGIRSSMGSSSNRNLAHTLVPSGSGHMLPEVVEYHARDYEPSFSGEELVFRILCPNKKIGSVIGRAGSVIKSLQDDIGAKIKITDPVPGSDERIIIISANEVLEDNLSPAQEALLHIQSQIVDLGPDKDGVITTKLLIPSNQTGCLLGKGGAIISEMRKQTRANIRIVPKEDLPPCALDSDEMVQIVGDIRAARAALVQVTSRLRSFIHREIGISGPFLSSSSAPDSSSKRRLEPSSPGRSYSPGLGFQAGSRSLPDAWQSKEISGRSLSEYDERATKQGGMKGSGISTAGLVTKTTVEVVIPEHAIAPLIANSLKGVSQIAQMSGAKVNLLEVRPGSDKVIEISGTPEQTHSAQGLLQAFILSSQSSRGSYSG